MADFISRENAINTAHSMRKVCDTDNIDDYHGLMVAALTDLPPSDVVEVWHGKWVHCDDGSLSWRCSVCGKHAYGNYTEVFSGEYHFCPNCGARMDGET